MQSKENPEKYVVAFRGTEPPAEGTLEKIKKLPGQLTDYYSDVKGAVIHDSQIESAYRVIEQLQKNNVELKDITVTGHSLGGRLAAEVAIKYEVQAYTFNAADVSAATKIKMNEKGRENSYQIINTASRSDFLSNTGAGLRNSEGGLNTSGTFFKHYSTGHTNVLKESDASHGISDLNKTIAVHGYSNPT